MHQPMIWINASTARRADAAPMPYKGTLAQYCRDRAARIRALADLTTLPDIKAQLFAIADELDQLERRFRDQLGQELTPERRSILAAQEGEVPADSQDRIRQWRMKAEELRTAADQMTDFGARDSLRRVASTYDKLAKDAAARFGGEEADPTKDAG